MGVREQRRRYKVIAAQLRQHIPLSAEQFDQLAEVFARIADGEDANAVLRVRATNGKSESDEVSRERMSMALSYVATLREEGMTLKQAMEEGSRLLRRLHGLHPDDPEDRFSPETLRKAWRRYPHMRSAVRHTMDEDWPL